ncbi:MAG: NUDIX hydrolase [Actinobacteria bacterium]|nr:NUDIX hydrolase [Actinomycetota bacterium]MBV8481006.1 NUDIX hydrolase [Actinomycetota bacterium]
MQPDASEVVWQGRLIAVTVERWGDREREIVEHPGAVAIVSVDTEGEMAFVRQLREATRGALLEIPAGTREAGEDPLATAQRELQEECGLTGGEWTRLGGFWTTPGFTREYMDVFLADGVVRGDAAPEDDEQIEVVRRRAGDRVALMDGIEDAKTLAALLLYLSR